MQILTSLPLFVNAPAEPPGDKHGISHSFVKPRTDDKA